MKQILIVLLLLLIFLLLSGCKNTSFQEAPENIDIYQMVPSNPDIPYADDLSSEPVVQIPDTLLTLDRVKGLFAPLEFKQYQLVSIENHAVSIYRSESGQAVLELEADKNEIVVALTVSSSDIDKATNLFSRFISLIIQRSLSDEEESNLIQRLQMLGLSSQEIAPDISWTVDSSCFVFAYDQTTDRFFISY